MKSIGLKRGTVKLKKYDQNWPILFDVEARKLKEIFGKNALLVEHIGSTSILGISAKPIIDIGLIVSSFQEVRQHLEALEKNGYVLHNEDRSERLFFTKGPESSRTHHLHIGEEGSSYVEDMILFRDYLNKSAEMIKEYSDLKQNLAKKYKNAREEYTLNKAGFVKSVIEKAKAEKFMK